MKNYPSWWEDESNIEAIYSKSLPVVDVDTWRINKNNQTMFQWLRHRTYKRVLWL